MKRSTPPASSTLWRWLILLVLALSITACAGGADEPDTSEALDAPAEEPAMPAATQPASSLTAPAAEGESVTPQPPVATETLPALPTIPEERLLIFEWPESIRAGDSDILRLSLQLNEDGSITPTVVFGEHELLDQPVQIENLYDTHLIRAEARLDLAGADIEPAGLIMQRLLPGEPVVFTWSISPREQGTIRGNVWMFVRYLPKEGQEGEESEKLIFTQPIEIQATNFLGLGGTPARVLGMIGIVISSLIGLDDVFRLARKVLKI